MRTICLKFKSCLAFTRLGFKHPVLPNLCISIHHLDATSPWEISIALAEQLDLGTKISALELSPGKLCVLSSVWAQEADEIPQSCLVSSTSGWVGVRKLNSNQTLFSNFSDFYLQGSPIGWVRAVDSKNLMVPQLALVIWLSWVYHSSNLQHSHLNCVETEIPNSGVHGTVWKQVLNINFLKIQFFNKFLL